MIETGRGTERGKRKDVLKYLVVEMGKNVVVVVEIDIREIGLSNHHHQRKRANPFKGAAARQQ